MSLKINEIFYSIQGESSFVGQPTVFVRTSGCHLRCTYCDTTYAYYDGKKLSVSDILEQVSKYPTKTVCLTGGEPLLQESANDLIRALCDNGYTVTVETSGDLPCTNLDLRAIPIVDIKTPDSGEPDRFSFENLRLTHTKKEFKFVICSEKDFIWSVEFVNNHLLLSQGPVFFSPSHTVIEPKWLAEKILASGLGVRLQMQVHKYIWPAETRGV